MIQPESEYLPLGWNMKKQVNETIDWVKDSQMTLPYYLNQDHIAKTMKKLACPGVDPFKTNNFSSNKSSITLQFNTGAYFAICPILVQQWIEMLVNGKKVDPCRLAGSQVEVSVTSVLPRNDKDGSIQEYVAKLLVDGQEITVTFYNTTLKIHLQGRSEILNSFSREIFLPFLERRVKEERRVIDDINMKMFTFSDPKMTTRGKKRSIVASKVRTTFTPQEKKRSLPAPRKKVISLPPAMLDEVLSVGDTSEEEDDPGSGGVEPLDPMALTFHSTQGLDVQDAASPAPVKAVWVDRDPSLPANWNSRSLPGEILEAALTKALGPSQQENRAADVVPHPKIVVTPPQCPPSPWPRVSSLASLCMARLPRNSWWRNSLLARLMTTPTHSSPYLPSTLNLHPTGMEEEPLSATRLEVESQPAPQLEDELLAATRLKGVENYSPFSSPQPTPSVLLAFQPPNSPLTIGSKRWAPTHDTTGDLMRLSGEMRSQRELLVYMDRRNQNIEKILVSQKQEIAILSAKFSGVAGWLDGENSSKQPFQQSPPEEQPPQPSPPEQQPPQQSPPEQQRPRVPPPMGARPRQEPQPAPSNQSSRAPLTTKSQTDSGYKCNDCGYEARSLKRIDNHITTHHSRPHHVQGTVDTYLLVGDSHLGSLNKRLRQLEKEGLGRGATLVTPGASNPNKDRAYCSTPDWTGAWHRDNSQMVIVEELLGERPYKGLILLAPTNDITNLKTVANKEERDNLATRSARNTVRTAEEALRSHPSLETVLIMEGPARVDGLLELSELRDQELKTVAGRSEFASKIKIGSNRSDLVATEEQKTKLFGSFGPKNDGIHFRGECGGQFLADTIIEAMRTAGLADRDSRVGRRWWSARGQDDESQPTRGQDGQRHQKRSRAHGARPAREMEEEQPRSWADVAANRFNALSN